MGGAPKEVTLGGTPKEVTLGGSGLRGIQHQSCNTLRSLQATRRLASNKTPTDSRRQAFFIAPLPNPLPSSGTEVPASGEREFHQAYFFFATLILMPTMLSGLTHWSNCAEVRWPN